MNKKIILIASILVVAALLFIGYNTFLAPKGVEGSKEITIQIVAQEHNIDEVYTYKTEHEFLYDLMLEKQEELGASFEEYDFGIMVSGMGNYVAKSDSEYFHITINGEDAVSGPKEIPINDQDTYKFELKSF